MNQKIPRWKNGVEADAVAGALPLLSTAYSRRFGVELRMQGCSAYTTGHVITIPRLNLSDPTVARTALGYLAHESAHIRYTSMRVFKEACKSGNLLRALVNILEDARVERLIGREFVGVWENLNLLRETEPSWSIFKYDLEHGDILPIRVICGALVSWCAVKGSQFPAQRPRAALLIRHLRRYFTGMRRHRIIRDILMLAESALKFKTTRDVMTCAEQIVKKVFDLFEGMPPSIESENDNSEQQGSGNNQDGQDQSEQDTQSQSEQDQSEQDQSEQGQTQPRPQSSSGQDQQGTQQQQQQQQQLRTTSQVRLDILNQFANSPKKELAPGMDFDQRIERLTEAGHGSRDDFGRVGAELCRPGDHADFGKGLKVSRLAAAMRRRLLAYVDTAHNLTAERGRTLNPYRAQFVPCGETRIMMPRTYEQEYSTAVSVVVDVSGSMMSCDGQVKSRAETACETALMICRSLDGIDGVFTQAIFFPGWDSEVAVAKSFRDRLTPAVVSRLDNRPRGSTPLTQAVWHTIGSIQEAGLRVERHVMFLITDGIPDSVDTSQDALCRFLACGGEIVGVGIRSDHLRNLLPANSGAEADLVVIDTAADLETVTFQMLDRYFSRRFKELADAVA